MSTLPSAPSSGLFKTLGEDKELVVQLLRPSLVAADRVALEDAANDAEETLAFLVGQHLVKARRRTRLGN